MEEHLGQKINLYDLCNQIGRVEGIVNQMSRTLEITLKDQTTRLNEVEKTTDQIVGKISIAGAIFGLIGGIVVNAIGYFIRK